MWIENGKVQNYELRMQFSVTDTACEPAEEVQFDVVVDFEGANIEAIMRQAASQRKISAQNGVLRPQGAEWMREVPKGYRVKYTEMCTKGAWPQATTEQGRRAAKKKLTGMVEKASTDEQIELLKTIAAKADPATLEVMKQLGLMK
jgi:hypothetical protein